MWNFKSSVNAQHCFCQHAQDQTRNQNADHKDIKSKSSAEVVDISNVFNGRWRGSASASKRLATSMTELGRADHARQLLEMTAWAKCRKYCWRPSGACLDPRFTQKTVKFGGGKIMVWSCIQYEGAREICKVDGRSVRWICNIDSAKYQQIIASHYIPNYKRGQIFQQEGAPCHTSDYSSYSR